MEISVMGTGYVGLVVGTCMADLGFRVTCVDTDAAKIELLNNGGVPIYEPGLEALVRRNRRQGRLRFSLDGATAVANSDVVYIAVGTPGLDTGHADLRGVEAVARQVGQNMARPTIVVIKSTVPVGTADRVRALVAEGTDFEFDVVSNPEFLKEGAAIDDFMRPDRIVVGLRSDRARKVMGHLYASLVRTGKSIHFMDNRSAELTKYASNAMLATKISFMNELARLCEEVGADIEMVRRGTGSDSRIGPRFLFAGAGYGGSCFPKDVRALIRTAQAAGLDLQIATAVEAVNATQKTLLGSKVLRTLGPDLTGRRVAVWGLSFKPGTDDMRDAPSLVLIDTLLAAGAKVVVHDPEARETAKEILGDRVSFAAAPLEAVEGVDALVLVTEWPEYRNPDLAELRDRMAGRHIFDGRNIYSPAEVRAAGFEYAGIGRL